MAQGRCLVCKTADFFIVVGAINWGLVGIAQMDLVATLLGPMSTASRVVYGLVGLAGLLRIGNWFKMCPCQRK